MPTSSGVQRMEEWPWLSLFCPARGGKRYAHQLAGLANQGITFKLTFRNERVGMSCRSVKTDFYVILCCRDSGFI